MCVCGGGGEERSERRALCSVSNTGDFTVDIYLLVQSLGDVLAVVTAFDRVFKGRATFFQMQGFPELGAKDHLWARFTSGS